MSQPVRPFPPFAIPLSFLMQYYQHAEKGVFEGEGVFEVES